MARIEYRIDTKVSDEELNRLFRASRQNHVQREFASILEHSLGYVCAYKENRLVGFVNVAWDGGAHGFLLDATVDPRVQRRGVGQKLVRRAIEIAEAADLEWLHVDDEPHLAEFYEEWGFQKKQASVLNLRSRESPTEATDASPHLFRSTAILLTVVGLDLGAVLGTMPSAMSVARWACLISILVGFAAGVVIGRQFNARFHFQGAQRFWPLFAGFFAAIIGPWLVTLAFTVVGSVAGWLAGGVIAALSRSRRRLVGPLLGMAGGCLVQAAWLDPKPALKFAALGAGIGVVSAPVIWFVYGALCVWLMSHVPPDDED
ncbi:MAG TPA: GNAT family N-acetyltransferase [Pirellulales bacterium]